MSGHPSHSRSSGGSKVTVLSTGEVQLSAASAGSAGPSTSAVSVGDSGVGGGAKGEPKRKVGTSFERSFAADQPTPPQVGVAAAAAAGPSGSGGSRPVLKAGKAVSSAPAPTQRPLTDLEKAFASRPVQDQRWLLSFPLALKQLYFGYAESPNHELLLASLIRRFPELLAGSEQAASPIQVAIDRGNWTPVLHFVRACSGGQQHARLLQRRCGLESRTLLILAVESFARGLQEQGGGDSSEAAARKAICALAEACPELAQAADSTGKNPLHHWAQQVASAAQGQQKQLLALLQDLRAASQGRPELARALGNALVARDAKSCQPIDLTGAAAAGREALAQWQQEQQETLMETESAQDRLCSTLTERGKAAEFVARLQGRLASRDPQFQLLGTVVNPVRVAVEWTASEPRYREELRLTLADIGMPELCSLVDSL